jgi:hypothetical protein
MISDDLLWFNKELKFLDYNHVSKINDPGPWMKKKDRYLGFKYNKSDKTIFGWIGFEIAGYSEYIIRDYAYQAFETDFNNDLINKNVSISPNPAEYFIDINYFGENNLEKVFIYDYLGSIIYCNEITGKAIEEKNFRIDISNISKGLYYIVVITDESKYTYKFLKN